MHVDRMAALSLEQLRVVVEAYAERSAALAEAGRLRYGLVFKNQGPRAGASLAHVHSQLIALPFIPPAVEAEIGRATEQQAASRAVRLLRLHRARTRCRQPRCFRRRWFHRLLPIRQLAAARGVGDANRATNRRLSLPSAAATGPTRSRAPQPFRAVGNRRSERCTSICCCGPRRWMASTTQPCHWRIELLPRANALAGLEVATGMHINPLSPEHAAQQLRTA